MTQSLTDQEFKEEESFIPYADPNKLPAALKEKLDAYLGRMGFLPNALKLYMHRPEIAGVLWTLNDTIMRDASSVLDQQLKRKLALVASKVNGCQYCTTHHCTIVKRPRDGLDEGWDIEQDEVNALLNEQYQPKDEKESVCFDFVTAASLDPTNVEDEIYTRLKQHLVPEEIVELASLIGFWKMYNTIHDSLRIPIEAALLEESQHVGL
ncbi:MAG: hypothetical protein HN764_00325 [Gammaproteobacteria bacterium]|jgi:uncharacterized peroxidase-related enzyme|nr:hypothetical protein [Gammaproteobacteria bacterium]